MSGEIVVDAVCRARDCLKGPTYQLRASCSNCQGKYIAEFRFGHKSESSIKCPHCGVACRALFEGLVEERSA